MVHIYSSERKKRYLKSGPDIVYAWLRVVVYLGSNIPLSELEYCSPAAVIAVPYAYTRDIFTYSIA